jgi:hypothetical protein
VKKFDIRNYTSSVAADKSILEIERILIEMGARNIAKQYDGFGKVDALSFSIPNGEGVIPFQLPVKRQALIDLFIGSIKRPTQTQKEMAKAQADRTAWKNMKEWVHLQATMIKLGQVEFQEVFMPYIFSMERGKTAYQIMQEGGYQKLLS